MIVFNIFKIVCIITLMVMIFFSCIIRSKKVENFFANHRICAIIVCILVILGYIFFTIDVYKK